MTSASLPLQWRDSPEATKRHATYIVGALKDAMKNKRYEGETRADTLLNKCYDYLDSSFDTTHGGFGSAPKFPEPCKGVALVTK